MYIKLIDNTPTSYTINQLRRDNPQVSFPSDIPNELLATYDVYPLKKVKPPYYNPDLQKLIQDIPTLINSEWTQTWKVINKTETELEAELTQWRQNMKVSPLQMRRSLRQQGLYEAVVDYVSQQDPEIQDAWEYAIEIHRTDALIAAAATELGYGATEVDDLFRLALEL